MADNTLHVDSVKMLHGHGTVEVVMDASQAGHRTIVETNALGMPNLVWVRVEIEHFLPTMLGYTYAEKGIAGTHWALKGQARNFVLISGVTSAPGFDEVTRRLHGHDRSN